MKHLIVLIIDDETHAAEAESGRSMSPAALLEQGQHVSDDAAGLLGYEAWAVIHNAPEELVKRIGDLNVGMPT